MFVIARLQVILVKAERVVSPIIDILQYQWSGVYVYPSYSLVSQNFIFTLLGKLVKLVLYAPDPIWITKGCCRVNSYWELPTQWKVFVYEVYTYDVK